MIVVSLRFDRTVCLTHDFVIQGFVANLGDRMRGKFEDQGGLFSYISPEARMPEAHPLRKIGELVRDVLRDLNRTFGQLYSTEGRPSIPPEQLLSALLLQAFYGIRSERQLMEQLDYNPERRASEDMIKTKVKESGRRITVGEDKAYDTADHVAKLRALNVTPHVAQYNSGNPNGRQSAIDGRTTRHDGYGMSQSCRAMAECIFGWGKQHGTMRKTKHRGPARVAADFLLNVAYNLVRIPGLIAA